MLLFVCCSLMGNLLLFVVFAGLLFMIEVSYTIMVFKSMREDYNCPPWLSKMVCLL